MNSELEHTSHLTYEQLLDYLERRLAPDDVRHVESHLATECSSCQSDLNWLNGTLSLMASDIWLEPPPRLSTAARGLFRENQSEAVPSFSLGSWLQNLWSQPRPVAIAFAATLVVVIGLGLLLRTQFPESINQEVSVAAAEGTVLALPPDSESWQPLTEDVTLASGTQVQTGENSSVVLTFPDDSKTVAAPNTELEILRMSSLPNGNRGVIVISQTLGQTFNVVQTSDSVNSRFEIRTPAARVVVRGTEFTVIVDEQGATEVLVAEGIVEVIAMGTTVSLTAGESTMVIPGQEPASPTAVPTRDNTETPGLGLTKTPQPVEEGATREPIEIDAPSPESTSPVASPTPTATASRSPTPTAPPTSDGNGGDESTPPPSATLPLPTPTLPPPSPTLPPPSPTLPPPSPTMPPPVVDTPTPDSGTHVPPGLTKTPQPPGQTKTPQSGNSSLKIKN
jgi:hypothetical protein